MLPSSRTGLLDHRYRTQHLVIKQVQAITGRLRRHSSGTSSERRRVSHRSRSNRHASSAPSEHAAKRLLNVDPQLKDIRPNDLKGTLDAHRKSNSEARIRWILHDNKLPEEDELGDVQPIETPITPTENGQSVPSLPERVARARRVTSTSLPTGDETIVRQMLAVTETGLGFPLPIKSFAGLSSAVFWPLNAKDRIRGANSQRDRLTADIRQLSQYVQLTSPELQFRQTQADKIIARLSSTYRDVHFEINGSQVYGLATTLSDIDIAFEIETLTTRSMRRGPSAGLGRPWNRALVVKKLHNFSALLSRSRHYKVRTVVTTARFPLINFTHAGCGVDVQIVYGSGKRWHMTYVCDYLAEFPHLKDVFFLINAALSARSLREPRTGGVGGYTLLMMIAASFKISRIHHKNDLVDCLLVFLQFYAQLEPHKDGIAMTPPGKFSKEKYQKFHVVRRRLNDRLKHDDQFRAHYMLTRGCGAQKWRLCLQDPSEPMNDLGRTSFAFLDVQAVLRSLHEHTINYLHGHEDPSIRQYGPLWKYLGNTLALTRDRRTQFDDWHSKSSPTDAGESIDLVT